MQYMRKLYLHLDGPGEFTYEVTPLAHKDRRANGTHQIEFRHRGMYARAWVNAIDLQLRKDLLGYYFADFRTVEMNDRIICARESRENITRDIDVGFCHWAEPDPD